VSIRTHHEPSASPDQFKTVVFPVYLANFICSFEKEKVNFDQIDAEIKQYFKLTSEDKFLNLVDILQKKFEDGLKDQHQLDKGR